MERNPFERFRRLRSPSDDSPPAQEGKPALKKAKTWRMAQIRWSQSKKDKTPPAGLKEKLGDAPLRLVIVGHNPSDHAWRTGHYYSNPSNRMWKILRSTGIAPEAIKSAEDDDSMLILASVGFTDIGTGVPGTDSSQFSFKIRKEWSRSFLERMRNYLQRSNQSIGCVCGKCGSPRIVAFVGKTHYISLYNSNCDPGTKIKTVSIGRQTDIPKNWPFAEDTELWVLPSTSGASALTNAERMEPFRELAQRLEQCPWPDVRRPSCLQSESQSEAAACSGQG